MVEQRTENPCVGSSILPRGKFHTARFALTLNSLRYLQGAREGIKESKLTPFSFTAIRGYLGLINENKGIGQKLRALAGSLPAYPILVSQERESSRRGTLNLGEDIYWCFTNDDGKFDQRLVDAVIDRNDLTDKDKALLLLVLEQYEILSEIDPKQPAYAYERATIEPGLLAQEKLARLKQIDQETSRLF